MQPYYTTIILAEVPDFYLKHLEIAIELDRGFSRHTVLSQSSLDASSY